MSNAPADLSPSPLRKALNKVPEVTLYFWLIKCLCTTIGETLSDNLTTSFAGSNNASVHALNVAAIKVMLITMGVLAVMLAIQFTRKRYIAAIYWTNIVVISVVGTQITDQFEGNGAQPHHMWSITIVSIALLGLVFLIWWLVERTLSMHSIRTARREAFYWLAILVTFATGTAVGDLVAEKFSLGYLTTLMVFVAVIAVIAAVWKFTAINGVLAFWLAYIMTRPLGASTGDFLSQKGNQGLNLGTSVTSYIFLAAITCLVVFLQIKKPDLTPVAEANADSIHHPHLPDLHHPHLPDLHHPHLPDLHLPHLPELHQPHAHPDLPLVPEVE
ncbi:MAG: hypothetical protein JWM55_449 [Acidimicrobiaceae bacterium]|nr:hypothetical protein [Acidimicrobiaceae bacterium]